MKQVIFKNGKYLTLDKKIPTMKALLVTDGKITASAEDFILQEIAPDAEVIDLKNGTLMPGFIETYSSILADAKEILEKDSSVTDITEALEATCKSYLSYGITTAVNARTSKENLEILRTADAAGKLSIDIAVYLKPDASDLLPEQMPVNNAYNGHIRLAGVSIAVDDLTGEDGLTELFEKCIKSHHQAAVEANSAASIEKVIKCYRAALINVNGEKTDDDGNVKPRIFEDLRPLLCGSAHLLDSQLTALQALGFTPCFTHDNVFYKGDSYLKSLSGEALDNIYPIRSIVKRGMAFSLQHDEAGMAPDMVKTISIACNRMAPSEFTIGPEQTINSDQAVNAVTLFAAYQLCEDVSKGSLTPSKTADFVVLDTNPLETSDANLKNIKILMTVKNGEVIKYGE